MADYFTLLTFSPQAHDLRRCLWDPWDALPTLQEFGNLELSHFTPLFGLAVFSSAGTVARYEQVKCRKTAVVSVATYIQNISEKPMTKPGWGMGFNHLSADPVNSLHAAILV